MKNAIRLLLDPALGAKVRAWVRVLAALLSIIVLVATKGTTMEAMLGALAIFQAALAVAVAAPTTPPTTEE